MESGQASREASGHKAITRKAYDYLLGLNDGYHLVDSDSKRAILKRISIGDLGPKAQRGTIALSAFDLVQIHHAETRDRVLGARVVDGLSAEAFRSIRLIEVKGTRGPRAQDLRGLFFSFQFPEQQAAQALGEHYAVVFVVVNFPPESSYHRSMAWSEMWSLAKSVHIQFSIRF